MLIGNYSVLNKHPGRDIGGGSIGLGQNRGEFNKPSMSRARFLSETWSKKSGVPDGVRPPYSWVIPQSAGGLSARNNVYGTGSITLTMAGGLNAEAALTGSGDLTGTGQLIISMVASLTGSGTITSATAEAFLNLAASLAGSGSITAAGTAIGHAAAALSGSGDLDALASALGTLAASIVVTGGELTAGEVASAVWSAIAATNDDPGTMGEKLNAAGSAGDPWTTALPGAYVAGTAGNIIGNIDDAAAIATAVWGAGSRTITGTVVVSSGSEDDIATAVWDNATRTLTASGLSAGDAEKLLHIWRLLGLDSSNPVTTTTAAIAATDIDVVITGNGETSTTLTRT